MSDFRVCITRDEFGRILDVATSDYHPGGGTAHSVTAEQLDSAAATYYERQSWRAAAFFATPWTRLSKDERQPWLDEVALFFRAAGFTVPEEGEA